MKINEVLGAILSTKEAKDYIVNEIINAITTVINSNKVALSDVGMQKKEITLIDVKNSFEKDLELLNPGNSFSSWDEATNEYKNIQVNLMWKLYKASAYKHAEFSFNDTAKLNEQLKEAIKQFSKIYSTKNRPGFPKQEFPGLDPKLFDTIFGNFFNNTK